MLLSNPRVVAESAYSRAGAASLQAIGQAIARIEGRAPRLPGAAMAGIALGHAGLDARLGGGLDPAGLHEVMPAAAGDSGAAIGFAFAVAARAMSKTGAALLVCDVALERECGLPYGPGLSAAGLDPARMVFVRAERAADAFWALEEALRVGTPVLAMALFAGRPAFYDLTTSRRLVLAARGAGRPALVVFAGRGGLAEGLVSAASTRWEIAAAPGPPGLAAVPERAAWRLRLLRNRRGQPDAWSVDWNHDDGTLAESAPRRGAASALSGDGARATPAGGGAALPRRRAG
jgi:protein ImuA